MSRSDQLALPSGLAADLAWCESVIRQHSTSFYLAFKGLAGGRAQAVFVIYAFCRLADDSIDVAHDPAGLTESAFILAGPPDPGRILKS